MNLYMCITIYPGLSVHYVYLAFRADFRCQGFFARKWTAQKISTITQKHIAAILNALNFLSASLNPVFYAFWYEDFVRISRLVLLSCKEVFRYVEKCFN